MSDGTINPWKSPEYNPSLKVRWSKHHLNILLGEIGKYLGSDPYSLSFEDDLKAGEHLAKLELKPLRDRAGLILGDFVSCLRGSLDHLATALTHCNGGVPNDRAAFPIIGVNNSDGRRDFLNAVKGVPDPAVTVIESLQPYHDGPTYEATKLWRLHRLWNIDKHRRIPFHVTKVQVWIAGPSDMPPIDSGSDNSGIMRFPLAAKGKVHLQPPVKVGVEFGDKSEGIIVPYGELIEIYDFVRKDVMPRFDRFF